MRVGLPIFQKSHKMAVITKVSLPISLFDVSRYATIPLYSKDFYYYNLNKSQSTLKRANYELPVICRELLILM